MNYRRYNLPPLSRKASILHPVGGISLFFFLICTLFVSAQVPTDTAAISRARNEGFKWVDKRKYPEAIAEYKKGLVYCDSSQAGWSGRSLLYSNIAASYQLSFQFDSAIYYARTAVTIKNSILKDTNSLSTAVAYRRLGSVYTDSRQPDSAIYYLQKGLSIVEHQAKNDPSKQSDIIMAIANAYLLGKSDYTMALNWFHKGLEMWEQQNPPVLIEIFRFSYSIGTVYRASANYMEARKWQEKSLPIAQSLKDTLRMSNAIRELAWIDYGESNLDQAEQRFRQVLELREIIYGQDHKLLADCYGDIGAVLNEKNQFGEALPFHEKAIQLGEKNYQPNHPRLAILYGNYSICLGKNGEFGNALLYAEKQLSIYRKNGKNSKEIADGCTFTGEILANLNEYSRAYQLQDEALDIHLTKITPPNREKILSILAAMVLINNAIDSFQRTERLRRQYASWMVESSDSNTELAYLLGKLGESAYYIGDIPLADSLFRQSFRLLGVDIDALNTNINLGSQLQYGLLSKIAGLEYSVYHGHPEFRAELVRYNEWGLALLNNSYLEATDQSTREGLIRSNYRHFMTAIRLACEKPSSEKMLQLAEKAKARTLASRWPVFDIPSQEIPEQQIEQERALQRNIASINESLFRNSPNQDSLKLVLFQLKNELQQEQKRIQKKYPTYFQERYGLKPPSLKEIRSQLTEDGTLFVEYIVHHKKLAIVALSKQSEYVHFQEMERPIQDWVSTFNRLIQNESTRYSTNTIDSLKLVGNQLYQLLLAQPLQQLGSNIKRIVIIPDGALGQLPFGALVTALPNNPYFQTWPWLSKQYALQYGTSAAVLIRQQKRTRKREEFDGDFAGFAPTYPESDPSIEHRFRSIPPNGDSYDLPYAREEVSRLTDLMGGQSWVGEAATEDNFRQSAGKYRILHLAMHGVANETQPEFSKLLFYAVPGKTSSESNGDLYAGDLSTIPLQADFAVLSACRTASGKTIQGEGVFSLSYGFMTAGIPAVLATQWSTHDKQTLPLMLDFYGQLRKGAPKDMALQWAVTNMLARAKDAPELAHPYYWAPFILNGSRRPLWEP